MAEENDDVFDHFESMHLSHKHDKKNNEDDETSGVKELLNLLSNKKLFKSILNFN